MKRQDLIFKKKNEGTGFNLELDCYKEKLKIAMEFNGKHHYRFVPFFHKTEEKFKSTKRRINLRKTFEKQGILLTVIPYWMKDGELKKMYDQISSSSLSSGKESSSEEPEE